MKEDEGRKKMMKEEGTFLFGWGGNAQYTFLCHLSSLNLSLDRKRTMVFSSRCALAAVAVLLLLGFASANELARGMCCCWCV